MRKPPPRPRSRDLQTDDNSPPIYPQAYFTVRRAGEMTHAGRTAIARWLRQHADDIETLGPLYNKRFTGRYYARPRGST
mgnify:CR=1